MAPERRRSRSQPPAHPAVERRPCTFLLDAQLVDRARQEVSEQDMVRSIEAALAAAIDYQLWVREVASGRRGALS